MNKGNFSEEEIENAKATYKSSIKELNDSETSIISTIASMNYINYDSLEERGYNPTNQIVGYLISGDPGYISSYKDSRSRIQEIDRSWRV